MRITTVELGQPAHIPDPHQVEIRAAVMLNLAKQGMRDMAPSNSFYRIMLGFFGVVVFGRSVTFALQKLRSFGEQAFDDWYAPWQAEMRGDPLCRFFNDLRREFVHDVTPVVGVVMDSGSGAYDPVDGFVRTGPVDAGAVDLGDDRPIPDTHRGKPIHSRDLRHLASLYVAYLEEVINSAQPVIAAVQRSWRTEHPWQPSQGP